MKKSKVIVGVDPGSDPPGVSSLKAADYSVIEQRIMGQVLTQAIIDRPFELPTLGQAKASAFPILRRVSPGIEPYLSVGGFKSKIKSMDLQVTSTVGLSPPAIELTLLEGYIKQMNDRISRQFLGGVYDERGHYAKISHQIIEETKSNLIKGFRELEDVFCRDAYRRPGAEHLLWGPNGEYLGMGTNTLFGDRYLERKQGAIRCREFPEIAFIATDSRRLKDMDLLQQRYRIGYDIDHARDVKPVLMFQTWDDVRKWSYRLAEGSRGDIFCESPAVCWASMNDEEAKLVRVLVRLRVSQSVMKSWIETLTKGSYTFGFGLLRDADDAFDALGVLADHLGDVDWVFDEREDAWTVDGSAMFLTPSRLGGLLGASQRDEETLRQFTELFTSIQDGAKDFKSIASTLEKAHRLSRGLQLQVEALYQSQLVPMLGKTYNPSEYVQNPWRIMGGTIL